MIWLIIIIAAVICWYTPLVRSTLFNRRLGDEIREMLARNLVQGGYPFLVLILAMVDRESQTRVLLWIGRFGAKFTARLLVWALRFRYDGNNSYILLMQGAAQGGHVKWCEDLRTDAAQIHAEYKDEYKDEFGQFLADSILLFAVWGSNVETARLGCRLGGNTKDLLIFARTPAMTEFLDSHTDMVR